MVDEREQSSGFRWDVLTIGHLSRNRYWGESDERSYRAPMCTCTLIRSDETTILVDPSLPPEEMAGPLDRRAGITPDSVDIVFLTHFHGDHRYGLDAFPNAKWRMPSAEIGMGMDQFDAGSPERAILDRLEPVGAELIGGISVIATPGHCAGHASLMFESDGMQVVLAADAAMTRDFFRNRDYYFNTTDPEAAVASIETVARLADIVIPGHDNFFLNTRAT